MTTVGYTEVSYAYNRIYTDKRTADSAERDHPRLYRTPKATGLEGEGLFYRMIYGDPQGIADGEDNFTSAQDSSSAVEGKQLSLTAQIKYGVIRLKGRAIRRAKGSKAAIFDLVTRHTSGQIRAIGTDLALDLQGDGSGVRGRIAAGGISGNTITLENKWDVDAFKKNMVVGASSLSTGLSPRSGTTTVSKVLRESKQIVLADASLIVSLAAADYLFRSGSPGNIIDGFGKLTPLSAPSTSDSFRGINRSDDIEMLAGWRADDTSKFAEEAILDMSAWAFAHGKGIPEADVPPQTFANMVKRLGAKVMYEKGRTADIGFRYIEIHGSGTSVKVFSEPDMKNQTISRMHTPSEHEIRTTGEFVHTIRDDGGNAALRMGTADAIEIRLCSECQYLQYDPGAFAVISHAA